MSGEKSALSVVVAGGGTAGHIEPALAVADAVRELVPDARITALGGAVPMVNMMLGDAARYAGAEAFPLFNA